MPRYVNYKVRSTKDLLKKDGRLRVRINKNWIDPFPTVHGTLPEKIVYAELSRRNIPFLFLNDMHFVFPEIDFDKEYQADFVIPSLRLIIEVQGAFWHSKPGTIESDAFKFAVYETGGYRVLAWWDFDIISNIHALFGADPQLSAASAPNSNTKSAELPVQKRTKVDTSKGIRTLNKKRSTRLSYRKPSVIIKTKKQKTYGSFSA